MAALVNERTRVLHARAPVRPAGRHAGADRIAAEHGLALVEDAAQAHGARVGGRGGRHRFGIGCFSFYATKNITPARAGWSPPRTTPVADRLRLLRNQGMRARYQYEMAGHN